jgi:hypothetical protein
MVVMVWSWADVDTEIELEPWTVAVTEVSVTSLIGRVLAISRIWASTKTSISPS